MSRATAHRRRVGRGAARRAALIALAIVAIVAAVPGYVLWSWGAPGADDTPTEFEIVRGTGVSQVARDLHAEGLVRDPRTFLVLLRLEGLDRRVGEGLYDLRPTMGAREVAAALGRGGRPRTVRLVLPEGSRLVDVAARLEAAGLAPAGAALSRLSEPTVLAPGAPLRLPTVGEAAPVDVPDDGDGDAAGAEAPAPDADANDSASDHDAPGMDAEAASAEASADADADSDAGDPEPDLIAPDRIEAEFVEPERTEPAEAAAPADAAPTAEPIDAWPVDGLEGYLFPASYDVPVRDDLDAIVERLVRRFEQELDTRTLERLAEERLSVHAWVTLASMVQAEAANDAEMPIIAGVFRNRLDIGMPLQSDPTVAYGLGKDLPALDFPGGDFDVDHPWNTYTRPGLPIGPIGSPGRAALDAVLAPERTDAAGREWLFFLHGADDGVPVFRPNLDFEGHLRDAERYLRR